MTHVSFACACWCLPRYLGKLACMSTKAERFGKAVRDRRESLDLSQLDIWLSGGPSNSTLTQIENGRMENLTRATAKKLDATLEWEAGSARRLWNGGEPTPLVEADLSSKESRVLREQIEAADLPARTKSELLRVLDEDAG